MTISIGIVSLAYCAGCELALIAVKRFNELLARRAIDIKYSTLIVDKEELEKVDVLFITGSIRTFEDVETIKKATNKASKIIAFGTCSCYGGIPGLANLSKREDIIKSIFNDITPTISGLPELTRFVIPLQTVIKVDYSIPGCPPPEPLIEMLLDSLISGKEFTLPQKSVCEECPLNDGDKKPLKELRRRLIALNDIDVDKCFMKQGVLCMGPATLAGCRALCPSRGAPCIGCMGPLPHSRDQAADIIDALGGIFYTVEPPEKVLEAIPDPVGLLSMFTLPYSTIPYHKEVGAKEVKRDGDRG